MMVFLSVGPPPPATSLLSRLIEACESPNKPVFRLVRQLAKEGLGQSRISERPDELTRSMMLLTGLQVWAEALKRPIRTTVAQAVENVLERFAEQDFEHVSEILAKGVTDQNPRKRLIAAQGFQSLNQERERRLAAAGLSDTPNQKARTSCRLLKIMSAAYRELVAPALPADRSASLISFDPAKAQTIKGARPFIFDRMKL